MNDPSNTRRSTHNRAARRSPFLTDGVAKPPRRAGVSRWRALETTRFRTLIASPSQKRPSRFF